MTHRNNARIKVVFLVILVCYLAAACSLPDLNGPANRSSYENDDNEENYSQPSATSLPTHTAAITPQLTKKNPPLATKKYSEITSAPLIPWLTTTIIRVCDLKMLFPMAISKQRPHNVDLAESHLGYGEHQPAMNFLSSTIFRSTMDLSMFFNNDNRTTTIGTFVPTDWAVM